MSSLESLKEAARRHEKREEWQKALDLYGQAIAELDDQETPDIGLFNRVGDLNARIGRAEAAVEHYERAVDLYVEAELANNAIALCKKIIRNLPGHFSAHLRMGRIRAEQGFVVDARNSFLAYAEQAEAAGDVDGALQALGEYVAIDPADPRVLVTLADLNASHDRTEEALRHLAVGYAALQEEGDTEGVRKLEEKAKEIDPAADLATMHVDRVSSEPEVDDDVETGELQIEPTAIPGSDDAEIEADFGEISIADAEPSDLDGAGLGDLGDSDSYGPGSDLPLVTFDDDVAEDDYGAEDDHEVEDGFGIQDADGGEDVEVVHDADVVEGDDIFGAIGDLATEEHLEDDVDEEDLGSDLPLVTFEDGDEEEEDDDIDVIEFAPEVTEPDSPVEVDVEDATEEPVPVDVPDDPAELFVKLADMAEQAPEDVAIPQRMVETAYRLNDDSAMAQACLALARALERSGEPEKARPVFQQVLSIEPGNAEAAAALQADADARESRRVEEVAASEDYVDLAAMIFDDEEEEKTTRFTVAYEEPSGDEDADFKKMLSQFKAKVAENFDATDVKAHHDLGTAYKEMGLLDEAIEEFQQALRASAEHLPTYELLGQVFMEKGEPEAAVNTLRRALRKSDEVDDELVGIYYFLGRAYEDLGEKKHAVEFYDKVFALDINFADVTERLRTLR